MLIPVLEAEERLENHRENVSPSWNSHFLLICRLHHRHHSQKTSWERFIAEVGIWWPEIQIWLDNHFCAAPEVRMGFAFINGWGEIRRICFVTWEKIMWNQIVLHKDLLEHSHAHSTFTLSLWPLPTPPHPYPLHKCRAEVVTTQTGQPTKSEIVTLWPFMEKVCQRLLQSNVIQQSHRCKPYM